MNGTAPGGSGAPALVVGVDLGGTKILARLVDRADPAHPLAVARRDTPRRADRAEGGEAILDAIAAVVHDLRSEAEDRGAVVAAVGVGAAGIVDRAGLLRFGPNLGGVAHLAVRDGLEQRLGLTVAVDNDATCATWAEARVGAAVGCADAVVVTLGTGIGAGIVAGGVLQRGANGFAGEAGHVVVDPNGPPCPCGRRGCWERYASGSGLGRLARDAAAAGTAPSLVSRAGGDPEAVRGEHVTDAAAAGDPVAADLLAQFGWWVALGVANLANLLDPEVVVLGGGLVEAGDLLLDPVRRAYHDLVLGDPYRPGLRIEPALLGADAGAIGAALLAADLLDAAPA